MSKQEPIYITTRQLRLRYGGVSHMWIERRLADDPEFPKPVYFGARRFWPVTAVERWERTRAANSRCPGATKTVGAASTEFGLDE
jgi:predicted DNA-binding transcriptional regulator AlpA